MWLISLLVLAVIAFFLVKFLTGKASEQDSSSSNAPVLENTTPTETNPVSPITESVVESANSASQSKALPDISVNTGDLHSDVREMIKMLNLAPSDASRLSLSREAFSALLSGDTANAPLAEELSASAAKLRQMLA